MTDSVEDITRRDFLKYAPLVGAAVGGLVPFPALAQDAPAVPKRAEDYSSPESSIRTLYHSLKSADLEGCRRAVDKEFKFGLTLPTGEFSDELYEPGRGIEAFFISLAPAEIRIGPRIYTRLAVEPIIDEVFIFPLSAQDADHIKLCYRKSFSPARRDQKDFAVAFVNFRYKILFESKEIFDNIPPFFLELQKKEDAWKVTQIERF